MDLVWPWIPLWCSCLTIEDLEAREARIKEAGGGGYEMRSEGLIAWNKARTMERKIVKEAQEAQEAQEGMKTQEAQAKN